MPAPAHLITPDYPGLDKAKPAPPINEPLVESSNNNQGGNNGNGAAGYCPGGKQ